MLQEAAQPVKLMAMNGVVRAQVPGQLAKFDPRGQGPRGFFVLDELAPGVGQGIDLQGYVLGAGRDAGGANLHGAAFKKRIS